MKFILIIYLFLFIIKLCILRFYLILFWSVIVTIFNVLLKIIILIFIVPKLFILWVKWLWSIILWIYMIWIGLLIFHQANKSFAEDLKPQYLIWSQLFHNQFLYVIFSMNQFIINQLMTFEKQIKIFISNLVVVYHIQSSEIIAKQFDNF